jgi:hypothetical protein
MLTAEKIHAKLKVVEAITKKVESLIEPLEEGFCNRRHLLDNDGVEIDAAWRVQDGYFNLLWLIVKVHKADLIEGHMDEIKLNLRIKYD